MSIFSVSGNLGTALSPLLVTVGVAWLDLQGTLVVTPVGLLISLFLYRQLSQLQTVEPQPSAPPHKSSLSPPQSRIELQTLLGLALVIVAVMCRSWFQVSVMTYLPEWMQSQGRSLAFGGQVLSLFMVAVSVGSLTGGTLSDYIGRWQIFVLSLGLLGPVHWFFTTTTGLWQIALIGIAGVLIGASFPVALVLAQETWPARIGLASALVMGLGWTPGGLGASVTGLIADQFSLTTGLQTLVVPPIVGVGAILAYVVVQRRGEVRKRLPLKESRF
jgi:FSR family fosmidomycin resistance protein-like MFS transporter